MRTNLDWEPFFEIASGELPYREKLHRVRRASRASTSRRERSSRSSARSTWRTSTRWPTSSSARRRRSDAIRKKVAALYPAHEVEPVHRSVLRAASSSGAATRDVTRRADMQQEELELEHASACPSPRASRAGDTSARRCCSSLPRAATSRKSSASTWCACSASSSTPAASRSTRSTASPARRGCRARTRREYCSQGAEPVRRVHLRRGGAADPPGLRERRELEVVAAGASIGAFNAVASALPPSGRLQARDRDERHVRPVEVSATAS